MEQLRLLQNLETCLQNLSEKSGKLSSSGELTWYESTIPKNAENDSIYQATVFAQNILRNIIEKNGGIPFPNFGEEIPPAMWNESQIAWVRDMSGFRSFSYPFIAPDGQLYSIVFKAFDIANISKQHAALDGWVERLKKGEIPGGGTQEEIIREGENMKIVQDMSIEETGSYMENSPVPLMTCTYDKIGEINLADFLLSEDYLNNENNELIQSVFKIEDGKVGNLPQGLCYLIKGINYRIESISKSMVSMTMIDYRTAAIMTMKEFIIRDKSEEEYNEIVEFAKSEDLEIFDNMIKEYKDSDLDLRGIFMNVLINIQGHPNPGILELNKYNAIKNVMQSPETFYKFGRIFENFSECISLYGNYSSQKIKTLVEEVSKGEISDFLKNNPELLKIIEKQFDSGKFQKMFGDKIIGEEGNFKEEYIVKNFKLILRQFGINEEGYEPKNYAEVVRYFNGAIITLSSGEAERQLKAADYMIEKYVENMLSFMVLIHKKGWTGVNGAYPSVGAPFTDRNCTISTPVDFDTMMNDEFYEPYAMNRLYKKIATEKEVYKNQDLEAEVESRVQSEILEMIKEGKGYDLTILINSALQFAKFLSGKIEDEKNYQNELKNYILTKYREMLPESEYILVSEDNQSLTV